MKTKCKYKLKILIHINKKLCLYLQNKPKQTSE